MATRGPKPGDSKIDQKQYEKDLRERQARHKAAIRDNNVATSWKPCKHDQCPDCVGTGRKLDGSVCIHGISCTCPKCTVYCWSGFRHF